MLENLSVLKHGPGRPIGRGRYKTERRVRMSSSTSSFVDRSTAPSPGQGEL